MVQGVSTNNAAAYTATSKLTPEQMAKPQAYADITTGTTTAPAGVKPKKKNTAAKVIVGTIITALVAVGAAVGLRKAGMIKKVADTGTMSKVQTAIARFADGVMVKAHKAYKAIAGKLPKATETVA